MQLKENNGHAEEGGHWYKPTGDTAYRIIGANGKERNTTLADARKIGLYPSTTTIIGLLQKAGLNTWLQQKVVETTIAHHRLEGEPDKDYQARILDLAKTESREASSRGTMIHAIIQGYFENVYMPEKPLYVDAVVMELNEVFGEQEWLSEHSFAHQELRYGGKVDLHSKAGIVVDIKTTEKDVTQIKPFHEQIMQLASYREGLKLGPMARCANIYVNALTNQVKVIEHDLNDLQDAFECFKCLLRFFQIKNRL